MTTTILSPASALPISVDAHLTSRAECRPAVILVMPHIPSPICDTLFAVAALLDNECKEVRIVELSPLRLRVIKPAAPQARSERCACEALRL